MQIGFHTSAFTIATWDFEQCLEWANRHDVHFVECGAIDGVTWNHGLGYVPHVALGEDPLLVRRTLDMYDVQFSQLDTAFPLSRREGANLGVEYVPTIRWAKLAGCQWVDSTDDRRPPVGMTDRDALVQMRWCYQQILKAAEAYQIVVNIEPHGRFTTKPDYLAEMLDFADSPYLRLNMDTGNTFIAGQDPVTFLTRFVDKVDHVHVKDVSSDLSARMQGKLTGIAVSHCAVGQGVNAENIQRCLEIRAEHGFDGVISIECEGQGGPLIEQSLAWVRDLVATVNRRVTATKSQGT